MSKDGFFLPKEAAIADMLSGLLDTEVTVKAVDMNDKLVDEVFCVSTYATNDNEVQLLGYGTLPAAAYLGGSLTRIPVNALADQVKSKKLTDDVLSNCQEIFNISVGLLNSNSTPHLRQLKFNSNADSNFDEQKSMLANSTQHYVAEITQSQLPDAKIGFCIITKAE